MEQKDSNSRPFLKLNLLPLSHLLLSQHMHTLIRKRIKKIIIIAVNNIIKLV